jgi:hypothetical protein
MCALGARTKRQRRTKGNQVLTLLSQTGRTDIACGARVERDKGRTDLGSLINLAMKQMTACQQWNCSLE